MNSKEEELYTSRTNKQNIPKKSQFETTVKPKKLSYSGLYEQKKSYLSQSMILN